MVEAPAGGGKTRFVAEFVRRLPPDFLFYAGNCYESTVAIPFQPWLSMLESSLTELGERTLAELSPHWRRQLSLLWPDLGDRTVAPAALEQQQLFRAITHLLLGLSQRAPCLLFLDDLQWADDASLQLFSFLAQQLSRRAAPILLAGAFRSEEFADNHSLQTLLLDLPRAGRGAPILLPSMDGVETEQIIAAVWYKLSDGFQTASVRDALLKATGGNPLFLIGERSSPPGLCSST